MNNIIGFVFNFHQQCDVEWEKQDPSYIKEKWNKYIGTDPLSNFIDSKYYHIPQLLRNDKINKWTNDKINKWIKMWKVSEKDFLELKEILYLLCSLNTKAMIIPDGYDEYDIDGLRIWNLESLIEEFSLFIDTEKINKEFYNHQHAIVQREIVRWLNNPINKRSYNLNLIL